jgi:hypothetical protein
MAMIFVICRSLCFPGFSPIIHDFPVPRNRKRTKRAKKPPDSEKTALTGGLIYGIVWFTCEWVLSFCALFRFGRAKGGGSRGREAVGIPGYATGIPILIRRCRYHARENHSEMQRVQAEKLQHDEEQEEYPRQA